MMGFLYQKKVIMRAINLLISSVFILLLSNSCKIKIIGVVNEYESAYEYQPAIMECGEKERPLCEAVYEKHCPILITTAKPLLTCLQNTQKAIVYEWPYRCKSEFCYLPSVVQAWCKEKGVTFYLLAEYYNMYYMQQDYNLEHPILAIDHQYYGTNKVRKYFEQFYMELIGRKRDLKTEWGRLCYFQEGEFQGFYKDLEEVDSLIALANDN